MAFIDACKNGNFNEAKRLYSLGADIHARDDYAFRFSCFYGHIELAKWLHSLGANIHAGNDSAFRFSCYNGHIELAKWLLTVGNINNEVVNQQYVKYNDEIIKVIFDNYYVPLNDAMKKYYYAYKNNEIR